MFQSSNYAAPPALDNCYSGAIRQGPAAHALHHGYSGYYGAPLPSVAKAQDVVRARSAASKKPKKPAVTRAQLADAVKKNSFLKQEDRDLAVALSRVDLAKAKPVLQKLAQMRDTLRRKSIAAAEGKTVGQIAGRAYLGVVTLGASEVGRLFAKKKISSARRKRAQAFLDKSVACDTVLRFYTAAFGAEVAKLNKVQLPKLTPAQKALLQTAKAQGTSIQNLEADGATADTPVSDAVVAAADREVESEAPAADVAKAAKDEDPAAVTAPVATDAEAAAITEATNAGAEPEKAVDTVADASGREALSGKPGLSKNAKIGLGVGAGVALLAAVSIFR
jgi:hypothetical protein